MDYNRLNSYLATLTLENDNKKKEEHDKDKEKLKLNQSLFDRKTQEDYRPEFLDNRLTNVKPLPIQYNNENESKKFYKKKKEDNYNQQLSQRHMSNLISNKPPPILDRFAKNSRDY